MFSSTPPPSDPTNWALVTANAPAWLSGHPYLTGQYVSDSSVLYMSKSAITSTTHPASDAAHWEVAIANLPCIHVASGNTLKLNNNFASGGGPWSSFAGSTIARTATTFTVTTPSPHTFVSGDYVLVAGASQQAYNSWWKIASVTSSTVTINFVNSLTTDTCTLSSLWSCLYINGLTESDMSFCFFNTGAQPGVGPDGSVGTVGVFLDSFSAGSINIQEFSLSDCISDFGACSMFLHGVANSDPGSSCKSITLSNCRPNGGPRDTFGCIRIEGCAIVSIDGCRMFPGNNTPPGTGQQFNSIVVSDGGQSQKTQDISITGGIATNLNSSALYPSASIYAFVFDGPNVKNVRIVNVGMDVTSSNAHVSQFLNGASLSNGIGILYFDSNGFLNSTGVLIAGVGSIGNPSNIVSSISSLYNVYLPPELGYSTSGSIGLNFGVNTNAFIGLTGNSSFSTSALKVGAWMLLSMKNTTAAAITLSWPSGWNWSNGASAPSSLAAAASLTYSLFSYGTTDSNVFVR